MNTPSFFIAWRYFVGRKSGEKTGKRGRNYLTGALLGIALSIIPLTVVLFVADGMIEGITSRYLETSTYHLQASPFISLNREELISAAHSIASCSNVSGAYAEMQGPAIVLSVKDSGDGGSSKTTGALIRAIDASLLEDEGFRHYMKAVQGQLSFERENEVFLGQALAKILKVSPGDLVTFLTTKEGNDNQRTGLANSKLTSLRVKAIVSTGYQELDALWAFVPLTTGERLLAPGNRRVFVGIKTKDPFDQMETLRSDISLVLRESEGLDWNVSNWGEIERNLLKSFSTTKALLILVMALAVAVAGVNLSSALIMLTLERKRDVAILKSSGATPGQIAKIFISLGALTGSLGTTIGLCLGCAISFGINYLIKGIESLINIILGFPSLFSNRFAPASVRLLNPTYYLEIIPVSISVPELALIALLSVAVCILASLLPARRAASLSPLEILRKN